MAWPKYDATTDPYLELNTTSSAEAANAQGAGYLLEGIAGYVFPDSGGQ